MRFCFGQEITADLFTDDRLDDTLDALSKIDLCKVFSEIASALSMHGVPVQMCHMDITNQSLSRQYNIDPEKQDKDFKIERGHPKDGNKKKKLVSYLGVVQQDGLPLFGNALSGNCSEAKEFRKYMKEIGDFFEGDLETNQFLVIDAAASNKETFKLSFNVKRPFIIRLSRVFGIADELVGKALADDCWENVGIITQNNGKKTAKYKITSFRESIDDKELRFVVVHSSSLEDTKRTTFTRNLPKRMQSLGKKCVFRFKLSTCSGSNRPL